MAFQRLDVRVQTLEGGGFLEALERLEALEELDSLERLEGLEVLEALDALEELEELEAQQRAMAKQGRKPHNIALYARAYSHITGVLFFAVTSVAQTI